ncbi:arsenate reductase ArsC [Pseudosulfitobacter pseudonitzschiae]|uniref:arsenate reductase ArsC n=1 Tax=Pseudosulfitobacter pseudonitzschiae TaxID=1402135 RepID=UPI001AF8D21F|nr:arsenate reductase ArsC [Pseudosulfitobacter pseudonitzschiae]MBM1817071.1 arsenate reductase ArsC [Pseudosulfitobacter pseudonitzschiae]MBM1834074.1 arsenate reductase ArsC [Pseudosulfitobacter pseudonitzschiae]MBM1838940.1 arsenate reductase ArsC [Pseudosulfitobacter pseudonitzschiae]MBM1843789.1 arsenate reductase ArsC [Pseudosulfitobacter pseudonitzschiae]MBM1848636.1 arsenate reductase ArsC [Pseudosulfitobacter pseudonitzschiae]
MNILVLCTGNSARSILLEHILNDAGIGRVRAFSAGSHPTGQVHPQSLKLLDAMEIDTSGARSKSWDEFAAEDAPIMDLVITVCGSAAAETCPMWPGAPVRAHWGVEDPAAAPDAEQEAAFQTAFEILNRRTQALLDHPFETMDVGELNALLKRIGTLQ